MISTIKLLRTVFLIYYLRKLGCSLWKTIKKNLWAAFLCCWGYVSCYTWLYRCAHLHKLLSHWVVLVLLVSCNDYLRIVQLFSFLRKKKIFHSLWKDLKKYIGISFLFVACVFCIPRSLFPRFVLRTLHFFFISKKILVKCESCPNVLFVVLLNRDFLWKLFMIFWEIANRAEAKHVQNT